MFTHASAIAAKVAGGVKAALVVALVVFSVWVAVRKGWPDAVRAVALAGIWASVIVGELVDHADARAHDELVAQIGMERNRAQAAGQSAGDALTAAMASSGGLAGLMGSMVGAPAPAPAEEGQEAPAT